MKDENEQTPNLEIAERLDEEADRYWFSNRYAEAEPLRREALSVREQVLGPSSSELIETIDGLAWILHEQGKYAESELLFRRSLELRRSVPDARRVSIATDLYHVALSCHAQRKFVEAKAFYEQALEIEELSGKNRLYIVDLYTKLQQDIKSEN